MIEYSLGDGGDLFGGLALAQDDLGKAHPQVAMMIDLRKSEVFIRQICQFVGCLFDAYPPGASLFEEAFYSVSVHGAILTQAFRELPAVELSLDDADPPVIRLSVRILPVVALGLQEVAPPSQLNAGCLTGRDGDQIPRKPGFLASFF